MVLTPAQFLAILAIISIAGGAVRLIVRQRQVARLRALAREHRMHFVVADRFHLLPRILAAIDAPGAASVRVNDLIYGIENENYRYLFCAQYTMGVLKGKTGVRRVGRLIEARRQEASSKPAHVAFAPPSLPLIEQYRHLLDERPAD